MSILHVSTYIITKFSTRNTLYPKTTVLILFSTLVHTKHHLLISLHANYANSIFDVIGCSPLQLGSISTPAINARCSSLLNDVSQLVEGIQGENIIYCYSSEATLQGSVAVAYCSQGYERVGPDRVTCGINGSWGELPVCQGINVMSEGQ